MKKTNQGFIVPLFVIIIVVLVAGGGAYIYNIKNKEAYTSDLDTSKNVSTSTMLQSTTSDKAVESNKPVNEDAVGIIKSVYTKNGKNYIDIDYIDLRSEIMNANPKIRTFEVLQNASIKLSNKRIDGQLTSGDYSINFGEFIEIFNINNKDDFRTDNPWNIEVRNGVIIKISENFRS